MIKLVLVTQSCLTPCDPMDSSLHFKQIFCHLSYQRSPLDGTWLWDNYFLQLSRGKKGRSLKVLGYPEKKITPGKPKQRWRGALSLWHPWAPRSEWVLPSLGFSYVKPIINDSVLTTSRADGTPDTLTLAASRPGAVHLQTLTLVDMGGKQALPWASIKTRI